MARARTRYGKRRRNRPPTVVGACAVVLALGLLGGCQPAGRGPEPAAGPTTTTLSSSDYLRRLGADVEQVRSGIALIVGAKTYADLQAQVWSSSAGVGVVAGRWRGVAAPSGAQSAHDRFIGLLSDLQGQIALAGSKVGRQELCAPPSVLAHLNESGVPGRLYAAGQELAAVAGGQLELGQLVPASASNSKRNRSLASGSVIRGRLTGPRRNYLTINNKDDVDSVLTLARGKTGKKPALSIYVRRKSKVTVRGIPNGAYRSFVADGSDWDAKLRVFTRDCSFSRFTGSESWGLAPRYTVGWTYTFGDKPGGKSETVDVPPGDAIQP